MNSNPVGEQHGTAKLKKQGSGTEQLAHALHCEPAHLHAAELTKFQLAPFGRSHGMHVALSIGETSQRTRIYFGVNASQCLAGNEWRACAVMKRAKVLALCFVYVILNIREK